MPHQSRKSPIGPASKAEKLSVLSALLGPEGLAKLREGQPDASDPTAGVNVEIDAGRAAWHRNKLLERLRSRSGESQIDGAHAMAATQGNLTQEPPLGRTIGGHSITEPVLDPGRRNGSLDFQLTTISDPETLGQEHPAVIARLMKGLSREERVVALKSLPGPVARSIVRRLR